MADLRMPDLNRVLIAGRLTRDPELTYVGNGTPLCKCGFASSRKYKTKSGEQREDTVFTNIEVWNAAAEWVGTHMKKGAPILVEGRLKMDEWQDSTTGQTRRQINITADRVQALAWDDSQSGNGWTETKTAPNPRVIEEPEVQDDIPF